MKAAIAASAASCSCGDKVAVAVGSAVGVAGSAGEDFGPVSLAAGGDTGGGGVLHPESTRTAPASAAVLAVATRCAPPVMCQTLTIRDSEKYRMEAICGQLGGVGANRFRQFGHRGRLRATGTVES